MKLRTDRRSSYLAPFGGGAWYWYWYLEMVEKEVIMKQKELLVNTVIGVLTTKAEYVRRRAVPRVQIHLQ